MDTPMEDQATTHFSQAGGSPKKVALAVLLGHGAPHTPLIRQCGCLGSGHDPMIPLSSG